MASEQDRPQQPGRRDDAAPTAGSGAGGANFDPHDIEAEDFVDDDLEDAPGTAKRGSTPRAADEAEETVVAAPSAAQQRSGADVTQPTAPATTGTDDAAAPDEPPKTAVPPTAAEAEGPAAGEERTGATGQGAADDPDATALSDPVAEEDPGTATTQFVDAPVGEAYPAPSPADTYPNDDASATTTIHNRDGLLETAPRATSRRPPLVVWVITGAWASLLMMCTFLYPAFAGYGEPQHVDLVYSFYNGNAFFGPGDRVVSAGVQRAQQTGFPPAHSLTSTRVIPRGQRPSFDSLGGDVAGSKRITNTAVEHPPLYYLLGAGVLKVFPHSHTWSYDRAIAVLRYLSILMLLPLPLLAWATARALVGNGAAATTAAALPVAIPGLTRVGASVTNETLLILLTSCLLFVLAHVLAGDLRRGTGLLVGLLTGLACLTQGLALVLPVMVIAAYGVAAARHRRDGWAPLLIAGLVTAAISGWWWIRNVALFGTIQPDGLGGAAGAVRGPATAGHSLGQYAHDFFVVLGWRTWGGIGLPEDPRFSLPLAWAWVVAVVVGAVAAVGFGVRGRFGRASALVLSLPTVLTIVLLFLAGRSDFEFSAYLPHSQGRYLYPTITALAVLLGIGAARLLGERPARWVPFVVIVAGLATQAWAWRQLLHAWWTPATSSTTDEIRDTVKAILRWSPWPHPVTSATFIAVAALGTLAALAAIGYGSRPDDDDVESERAIADDQYYASLT